MGKKGTKRKTKWRALPLGEEAEGSGNEEDIHDEDVSTTSSVNGGHTAGVNFRRQSFYFKMADRPFRQTRRFPHDKFRNKEPLIKLESKTFDEEEYTKITTPRQDVLFKKGCFGKKRENSTEETSPPTGEMDEEEPMMDQIIITNGFVDERGHYLVNGNSYEIYDPYSNTVTIVVGPPPYANGVTQPVLAAVSCQPVPLQPVDWYPPGADWPAQGSAWTPSYPRPLPPDSTPGSDGPPTFPSPDPQIPSLYNQPAYVVPGYAYNESPVLNGVPLQTNPPTEAQNSEENRLELKKTRRKSTETPKDEGVEHGGYGDSGDNGKENEKTKQNEINGEDVKPDETEKSPIFAQDAPEVAPLLSSPSPLPLPLPCVNQNVPDDQRQNELQTAVTRQVEKQSHSTQTNLLETTPHPREKLSGKESHSTQTPSEETLQINHVDLKAEERNNKRSSDAMLSSLPKTEEQKKQMWKPQANRFPNSSKKFREEFPRKPFQQRTNFTEERKLSTEKTDSSPYKVSYAKKAMIGLQNGNQKVVNGQPAKVVDGGFKNHTLVVNGTPQTMVNGMNGMNGMNGTNRTNSSRPPYEDKRNGFVRARYNRGRTTNDQTSPKYKDRKFEQRAFDEPQKKFVESNANESQTPSEKSSTISELSSPTGLSSGQNTPPEKLIVQKMEEEINKSFEEKLKQNLTRNEKDKEEKEEEQEEKEKEEEEEEEEEEIEDQVKPEEKPKGKKKKNKGKLEAEKPKESRREKKKKKKRAQEESKEKSESENSSEDIAFLTNIREKDLLFGSWDGLKSEGETFISGMDSLLNGDKEILKSLGLNDDRSSYSKLPLHSDLLTMLPTFGWARPKLKIEDFFAPPSCESDLFTKRNITNMKSTKPEEFFASVIDSPVAEKTETKKEPQKKPSKSEKSEKTPKTGYKASKNAAKKVDEEAKKENTENEVKEVKLGIVDAVNTWLQEQGDSDKFIPVENFERIIPKEKCSEPDQKNGGSNPIHAPSRDEKTADVREDCGCIRVANVVSDGFVFVSPEFPERKKPGRIYRSSSWNAKLSERNLKKHLKFLTDSASFCQDLISDVRNGLPTGNEYATEELCDPRQTVAKYYTLAPSGRPPRNESDSENEVFDALEYKFMTKENQETEGKSPDGNGNASITDSGVHSDMESSEDNVTDVQKEATCKLQ